MKKIYLILSLLLLSGTFASCGSNDDAEVTQSSETTVTEETAAETEVLTDGLPEVDMNGFEFSVYNNSMLKMTWTNTKLDAEEMDGDVLNNAIYNRNRSVEERFNCTIKVRSEGDQIGADIVS